VAAPSMILFAACVRMTPPVASPSGVADVEPGSSLLLVNVGSLKCFAPTPRDGHSDWAGLPIQQRGCEQPPDPNKMQNVQAYDFVPLGNVRYNKESNPWWCSGCILVGKPGYFIRNSLTGLCLDARDGAKTDGSVVQQWTCKTANDRSMVWYVEPGDFPDAYRIRNINSDLCLDVKSGSFDDYAQLQQYHCTSNNTAQNFWQEDFGSLINTELELNTYWSDGSTTRRIRIYE